MEDERWEQRKADAAQALFEAGREIEAAGRELAEVIPLPARAPVEFTEAELTDLLDVLARAHRGHLTDAAHRAYEKLKRAHAIESGPGGGFAA